MQLLLDRYLSTIRLPLNMFLASTASQLVLGTGRDLLMSREFVALHETNISHLGKRNIIIFKICQLGGDMLSFPGRVWCFFVFSI